jgi:hypothetical protein
MWWMRQLISREMSTRPAAPSKRQPIVRLDPAELVNGGEVQGNPPMLEGLNLIRSEE